MSIPEALLSFDPTGDIRDLRERFVSRALFDAGVWSSSRTADGVLSCRVVERTPVRLRVCGRIWEIDQTLRSFWLDLVRADALPERISWTLYFDVDAASVGERRARDAVDAIEDPGEIRWAVTLKGKG